MVAPPPSWTATTGMGPNMFELGVYSPEGVYGQGKMKMVGFSPFSRKNDNEGDPDQFGFRPGLGSVPMFEGRRGLMQCGIDPSTGEYMVDEEGKARCWYMPVTAGSRFVGHSGMGAIVNPYTDIVHSAPQEEFSRRIPQIPFRPWSQSWALKFRAVPEALFRHKLFLIVGALTVGWAAWWLVWGRKEIATEEEVMEAPKGPSALTRDLVGPATKLAKAKRTGKGLKAANAAIYKVLKKHGYKFMKGIIPAGLSKEELDNPEILAKTISCIAQVSKVQGVAKGLGGRGGANPFAICRSSVTKGFSGRGVVESE